MARYSVAWKAKDHTLVIKPFSAKDTKGEENLGEIFLAVEGEIPDASPHPAPGEHLKNLARRAGYDDYNLVNVVNNTDHEGFDLFAQEVDEEYQRQYDLAEEAKLTAGSGPTDITEEEREKNSRSTLISENSRDGILEGPTK